MVSVVGNDTMTELGQVTADQAVPEPGLDTSRPNAARMHDYHLGGKNHFPADREAAEKVLSVVSHGGELARANRSFLVRAVELMAREGVAQFIDLGTGFPVLPAVHHMARDVIPDARVLYVDYDPVVVGHCGAVLATNDGVATICGDIRYPEAIFSHPKTRATIDFGRPVGVLLGAVLHFLRDSERPDRVVAAFAGRMVPGSMLAISHICSDHTSAPVQQAIEHVYSSSIVPVSFRTREQIAGFFGTLPLIAPGLAEVGYWHHGPRPVWTLELLAGVAAQP